MNKDIIVYSLIFILIILIIYLFLGFRQLSSTVSDNDPQSPTSSIPPNIDLSNYYTKSEIDSSFPTKSDVDTNIHNSISNISTDQGGNVFRPAGAQELGYEVGLDGKINFLSPVEFKENVNFVENVGFNHTNKLINTLPRGSIMAWNSTIVPKGWALCDGQSYNLDSNGDAQVDPTGVQTPDLRGRFILGAGQGNSLTNRELGETDGEEDVTLKPGQMPSHKHNFSLHTTTSGYQDVHTWYAANEAAANRSTRGYSTGYDYDWGRSGDYGGPHRTWTTESTGNGQSHNNMPPYNVLTYIIKL